jgi:hypothetical protein
MKKITLSDVEINELLDLYQSEIDRSQRRINNLKRTIEKLSEGQSVKQKEEKITKIKGKRGRKPKVKVEEVKAPVEKVVKKEPKKRGRKPKFVEIKPEPKKRGRKPKVKTLDERVISDKIVTKEPKQKEIKTKNVLKKRGRKPIAKPIIAKPTKKIVEKKIPKEKKKAGRKKKVTLTKTSPKKIVKSKVLRKPIKSGKGKDKVKWNDFITETITSKNSLMLASSLTRAALEKFSIPASDRDRVRMAISTALTKLTNKDKVLQTYLQPGIKGAFFGLASWFNEKKELNSDYKKRLM